jgi:hypothetical protein
VIVDAVLDMRFPRFRRAACRQDAPNPPRTANGSLERRRTRLPTGRPIALGALRGMRAAAHASPVGNKAAARLRCESAPFAAFGTAAAIP